MQVYLVKSYKIQLGEQQRLQNVFPDAKSMGQFTVELNPSVMRWFQSELDERDPTYGLYERVIQFLLGNLNATKDLTVQLVNTPDAYMNFIQFFSPSNSQRRDKLELKIFGDILLDFHVAFGNSLRLTVEISNASRGHDEYHSGNISYQNGFLSSSRAQLPLPPPPPPTQMSHCRHVPPVIPVYRHVITEEPRISVENIPLPPAPPAPVESVTKQMKIVIKPGVAAYCTDDDVKFPQGWHRHWTSNDREDSQVTAEISIILSVVEGADDDEKETEVDEISSVAKKLLQEEIRTDLEIVPGNGNAVKCHSAILVAQSEVFEGMFVSSMTEAQTNTITVQDMSEEGVKGLLAYLYYRDLEKARQCSFVAVELLETGRKYLIDKLESRVKSILLVKPIDWFHVDAALTLFFFATKLEQHVDLKARSVRILKSKPVQLKESAMYQKLFRENQQAALEISNAFLELV